MRKLSKIRMICGMAPLFAAAMASATDLYWVGPGGATPSGTWDTTTANWAPNSDGSGTLVAWPTTGANAIFSAGAGATGSYQITIPTTYDTIYNPLLASGIQFTSGTVTLADFDTTQPSGISASSGLLPISVNPGLTATIANTITDYPLDSSGTNILPLRVVKNGAGTLVLAPAVYTGMPTAGPGSNMFSGGVTINAGVLEFGGELNATPGSVNPLGYYPNAPVADYIQIGNAATLRNTKVDTLGLASFVLVNRGITITGGNATLEVTDSGTRLNQTSVITESVVGQRIIKTGDGTLNISGSNTFTGGVTVKQGALAWLSDNPTLAFGSAQPLGRLPDHLISDAITVDGATLRWLGSGAGSTFLSPYRGVTITSNGGTIDVPQSAAKIYCYAPISGGALTKTGAGEFRPITGSFSKLIVKGGLYRIGSTTFGSGPFAGTTAGAGQENAFGAVPASPTSDAISVEGVGTDFASGGAALGTTASIVTPPNRGISVSANGLTIVLNAAWEIQSPISGAGGIALNGNGWTGASSQLLTLSGANTYQGGTKINYGTIELKNGNAIPDTSTVTLDTASAITNVLKVSSSETIGALAGGNAANANENVNLNGAGVTLTTGANNADTSFASPIIGSGSLAKAGSGNFTLSGVNTYSGSTTVNAGTLTVNSSSNISTGALVVNGGTLDLKNASQTVAGISGTGGNVVAESGHTLTSNAGVDAAYAGAISGAGSFVKQGAGVQGVGNLSVAGISVAAGTLAVNGTTTHSNISIVAGATLGGTGTLTWNLASDAGDLITNSGTLDLTALNLAVNISGTQTASEYVIANDAAGSLTGSHFASVTGLPAGASLNYAGTTAHPSSIVLSFGPAFIKGDMNGDGSFNNFDITPFVLALTDVNTYKANYPKMTSIYQQVGDMNSDGSFNNFDITPFVTALTSPHAAEQMAAALASVPEPGALGLLASFGLMAVRRRRRA